MKPQNANRLQLAGALLMVFGLMTTCLNSLIVAVTRIPWLKLCPVFPSAIIIGVFAIYTGMVFDNLNRRLPLSK